MKHATVVVVVIASLFGIGCGSSPAPREPVVMVPIAPGRGPVDCDTTEDDEIVAPPREVAQVPLEEWQPTDSVRRLETKITRRGDAPRDYLSFPKLTLHRDIPATTFSGRGARYRR